MWRGGLCRGDGRVYIHPAVLASVTVTVTVFMHQQLSPPEKENGLRSGLKKRRTQTANARHAPRCFAAHS